MTDRKQSKTKLGLADIVGVLGLPTQPELLKEGQDVPRELYTQVVLKLAQAYLAAVLLRLAPTAEDGVWELLPMEGHEWRDTAYLLGHRLNLLEGSEKIHSTEDLLSLPQATGGEPYPDYRRAVAANLYLVGRGPAGDQEPAQALRETLRNVDLLRQGLAKAAAGGG